MTAPAAQRAETSTPVRRIDAAGLLEQMLRIDSPSGSEREIALFLRRELSAAGFAAHIDDAGNLVAMLGEGSQTIACVGHLDTAPGRVRTRSERGVLHGRGAVDAKGPLAAAIAAASRAQRSDRRVVIVGAVEEEAESRGAHHLARCMAPPDALVILEPSGWEGVTVGYKGSIRVRWMRSQPAGHGAGPEPSAGDHAVAYVRALQEHAAALRQGPGIFDAVDVRVLRCDTSSDGLVDRALVDVGLRVPPGCDTTALRTAIQELAGEARVDVRYADDGVRTERSSPLARAFVRAVRDEGGSPRFKLKTGTSDLNILAPAWRCPAVAYGPGDSRLDHTPDEHIALDELERGVRVLERVLGDA